MRTRMAWLAILCLALGAIPASAQFFTYDNGPVNGTTNAWTINFGFTVSDTFVAGSYPATGFAFYVWEIEGDSVTSVSWSITSGENSGTVLGSGTAVGPGLTDRFISTNQYSYDIDLLTVTGINGGSEQDGTTYWLNLVNATTKDGEPVYWDENSGVGCGGLNGTGQGCPSLASENDEGTIPSDAFTISGIETTPEPSSIMLLATGIFGLAGVLRQKLL